MNAAASPWHAGEIALQRRAGSAEALAEVGRRVVRTEMPQQHRDFFPLLPFVAIGAADAEGQPWATLLAGPPGFASSPAPSRLRIDALPPADDPLHGRIEPGAPLALLGIELHTRRRNRANGAVGAVDGAGFSIDVRQSFGNCPKYIQPRALRPAPAEAEAPSEGQLLDGRAAEIVAQADTFFIASQALTGEMSGGPDVSHRGGPPGFVRLADDGRGLAWPDYAGNRFFNTLGNLELDPRAGLVFVDFARGDLLHLAGTARLDPGGEPLVRFHLASWRLRPGALPLRGTLL